MNIKDYKKFTAGDLDEDKAEWINNKEDAYRD